MLRKDGKDSEDSSGPSCPGFLSTVTYFRWVRLQLFHRSTGRLCGWTVARMEADPGSLDAELVAPTTRLWLQEGKPSQTLPKRAVPSEGTFFFVSSPSGSVVPIKLGIMF